MQVQVERPPNVNFERRAIELKDASGLSKYVEKDFAIITPQGTKDRVERDVGEWFDYLRMLEDMQRWDPSWTRMFKESYAYWKKTNEVPLNGTPVANWPVATKSEVTILRAINILTVEDLAAATEEAMQRMGMGGRSLKLRAQDWIAAKTGGNTALVQQLDAARISIERLEATVKQQQESIAQLKTLGVASQQMRMEPSEVRMDSGTVLAGLRGRADDDLEEILK